ncbi:nucleoside-triphosphate diphosphatase [Streptococcus danieliae]|uniref:nucleoside-triphosphate diphosphatase n=1 Tax=Streptococcus danieliae TaxID=747656 RepID=UPI0021C92109|nr:nucleoside-triphosphate diphosphatase [Streptococcus danieliae]MCU0081717.1 nucleoside-triphosphate diphosphatase [Streptococcus danieliae]
MKQELVEFRDGQDWYVAQVSDGPHLSFAFDQEDQVYHFLAPFQNLSQKNDFKVQVFQWSSAQKLARFMVDLINRSEDRQLTLERRGAALLVVEDGRLLHVALPENGEELAKVLGEADLEPLLIATRNEGKTAEFKKIFEPLGFRVENLNDYPDLPEIAETGTTFEANARLKAEGIAAITETMVLADDSGLKVDVLGGLPGVWSARFAGPDATDADNNAKLLHELAMVLEADKRSAQFHTTLVVAAPGRESLVVEADWPGYIAFEPKGENGFGYDPLFLIGETGKTSAQLSMEEKNQQSHRAQAVEKLVEVFPSWRDGQ